MTDEKVVLDKDLIGMEKYAAIVKIESQQYVARIVAEDGEQFMITYDYRPERLNLEIVKGKVAAVHRG